MNIEDVMSEIGEKLETIPQLRVFPYWADKIAPPAAIVGLPEDIKYDETYGRGSDAVTVPVWLLVSRASDRASNAQLAAYLSGSGTRSVKAAVDSKRLTNEYASCDTVTVVTAKTGTYTSSGVSLLGAEFSVQVTGSGS